MLHTVVAAYFHFVARLFKNPTLEDYVETVVRRRLRSQQLSPALTLEVGTGLVVGGAGPAAFGIPPRSSRGYVMEGEGGWVVCGFAMCWLLCLHCHRGHTVIVFEKNSDRFFLLCDLLLPSPFRFLPGVSLQWEVARWCTRGRAGTIVRMASGAWSGVAPAAVAAAPAAASTKSTSSLTRRRLR